MQTGESTFDFIKSDDASFFKNQMVSTIKSKLDYGVGNPFENVFIIKITWIYTAFDASKNLNYELIAQAVVPLKVDLGEDTFDFLVKTMNSSLVPVRQHFFEKSQKEMSSSDEQENILVAARDLTWSIQNSLKKRI